MNKFVTGGDEEDRAVADAATTAADAENDPDADDDHDDQYRSVYALRSVEGQFMRFVAEQLRLCRQLPHPRSVPVTNEITHIEALCDAWTVVPR